MSALRRPGDRVTLNSPHGELRRGNERCLLAIKNGQPGTVVGSGGMTMVVVAFAAIGGTVGVSVPIHWLADDEGRPAASDSMRVPA